jgi:6-phosphogluconolactonase
MIEGGINPDMKLLELEFENSSALDAALVSKVTELLTRAIKNSGTASLVVSGGRTPLAFFHMLSQQVLDWSKVVVTLADERWVDTDHSDSSEKLVRENLLINEAHTAEFIPLKNSAMDAVEGELQSESDIESLGQFTVVILGMGDDGHTASLFPGAKTLALGLDMNSGRTAIAVMPTAAPHQRMTLTLPRLLDSQQIILHIKGAGKQGVLQAAQKGDDITELPIRAILNQHVAPLSIFWAK